LLSLLLPGLGDYKVREGRGFWAIGALAVGLMGTGIIYKINGDKKYAQYQQAQTLTETRQLYNTANTQRRTYIYLTRAAAAIWLSDIALVAIRGARNRQVQHIIQSKRSSLNFQLHYDDMAKYPALGLQYRF
jgi:hypothetical protein